VRYLLAILMFFLTAADIFGWTQSLAPGMSVKNALIYLILLGLAGRFVVRGGIRLELPQVHLWFGVLIAYAIFTWLAAGIIIQYKSYSILNTGIDLKANLIDNLVIFVLFLYGTRSLADAKFLLKSILLAVTLANAIAIGNAAGWFNIGYTIVGGEGNLAGRVHGAFGHANETGALCVCLLPALVAATMSARNMISRLIWAGATLVSFALMVMTGSRGAFVGLVCGAVLATYVCHRIVSWRRAGIFAAVMVLVAVPLLALVALKFNGIMSDRVLQMVLDPSTHGDERTYIWMPVIDRMMSQPITLLTGYGWDVYSVMGFFYVAHNHYLLLWFELGIIGLGSYLLLLRQLIITARRGAEQASGETARYLTAFVYGILALSAAVFFTLIFKPWLYVWAYTGLTMRMAIIATQTAKSTSKSKTASSRSPAARAAIAPKPATARGGLRSPAAQRGR
jgi:O-antigen ligase